MKNFKRLGAVFLALAMVVSLVVPSIGRVNAAGESKDSNAKTKTVTVHKMLLAKDNLSNAKFPGKEGLDGTKYEGNEIEAGKIAAYFGAGAKEMNDVVFAWQKKDVGGWKYIGSNGEILMQQPDKETTADFADVLKGTTVDGTGFKFTGLDNFKGEYRIVEVKGLSKYKGTNGEAIVASKAVPVEITLPLVNENGTVVDAHVYPKNAEDKPSADKNFAKDNGLTKVTDDQNLLNAGADVENYAKKKATVTAEKGKSIPYEIKTKVNAGAGYEKLVWKDTMTNGLTFNTTGGTNGVTLTATNVALTANDDYKVVADYRGFTLYLTAAGLKKVSDATKPGETGGSDVEFTLTYSATVNGTTIVDNPEKNDVSIEYGHKPYEEHNPTPVKPKNGELIVTKTWSDGNVPEKVSVVYSLKKAGVAKASVTLKKGSTGIYELGNGIKFEVTDTDKLSGKFTGLGDDANDWTIEERVAGYKETITAGGDGEVSIKNDKDNDNPPPLVPETPEVVNGGKKFVKTSETETELLAGAKFVIVNKIDGGDKNKYLAIKNDVAKTKEQEELATAKKALDDKVNEYNALTVDKQATEGVEIKNSIDDLQKKYNEAFKKASIAYKWVEQKDDADVVKLESNSKGQFEISGLAYGKYELEEIQAPTGYAKINNQEFTVSAGSYTTGGTIKYDTDTSNDNDANQVINKKVSIPQTGGIGTIIFAVAGIALMGFAAYSMKKNSREE